MVSELFRCSHPAQPSSRTALGIGIGVMALVLTLILVLGHVLLGSFGVPVVDGELWGRLVFDVFVGLVAASCGVFLAWFLYALLKALRALAIEIGECVLEQVAMRRLRRRAR